MKNLPLIWRDCPKCGKRYYKRTIYCSAGCYFSVPVTEETRQKMLQSRKGKPKPPGFGAKVSKATSGQPKPWVKRARSP